MSHSEARREHSQSTLDGLLIFRCSRYWRVDISALSVRCVLPVAACAHVRSASSLLQHAGDHVLVWFAQCYKLLHDCLTDFVGQRWDDSVIPAFVFE